MGRRSAWWEDHGPESDTVGLRPGSALISKCLVLGKRTDLFLPSLLICELG